MGVGRRTLGLVEEEGCVAECLVAEGGEGVVEEAGVEDGFGEHNTNIISLVLEEALVEALEEVALVVHEAEEALSEVLELEGDLVVGEAGALVAPLEAVVELVEHLEEGVLGLLLAVGGLLGREEGLLLDLRELHGVVHEEALLEGEVVLARAASLAADGGLVDLGRHEGEGVLVVLGLLEEDWRLAEGRGLSIPVVVGAVALELALPVDLGGMGGGHITW